MNWVIYNVFEEAHNLPRSIESVKTFLPGSAFVFADGAYPNWESDSRLSEDGTKEIAEKEGFYLPLPDVDECGKRTAALRFIDERARQGDWVLVLDADETITSIFGQAKRVGSIEFTRTSGVIVSYGRCRLYRWEPGLYFAGKHYLLWDANGELVSSLEDAPDYQLVGTGLHFNDAHSKERFAIKKTYYADLRKQEEQVKVGAWA